MNRKVNFLTDDDKLILIYNDYSDWVMSVLEEDNYYKISKMKINTTFDLYIDISCQIDIDWFVASVNQKTYIGEDGIKKQTSMYGNILTCFRRFYDKDKLYIDINSQHSFVDNGFHITEATYKKFVRLYPTTTNVKYLRLSIYTNVLKNELDVKDYAEIYERYKTKMINYHIRNDDVIDEILKDDKHKYLVIREKLKEKLDICKNGGYVHEDDFSYLIAKIFCLLNPKYIMIKQKLNITDYLGVRKNCQADLALIDFDGNIDLIEVKSPLRYQNLFRKSQYRNHYVPSGELNGCINQLEQYLKSLTKMTSAQIISKNTGLQEELGDIKLKAISPKGYVIFGLDEVSFDGEDSNQKRADFQIIKNSYNHLVDIITFDELIMRIDKIINSSL